MKESHSGSDLKPAREIKKTVRNHNATVVGILEGETLRSERHFRESRALADLPAILSNLPFLVKFLGESIFLSSLM